MANPAGIAVLSITGLLAVLLYMSHDETQTADIKSRQAEQRCEAARFDFKDVRADRLSEQKEVADAAARVTKECATFEDSRVEQAAADKKKLESNEKLQESLKVLQNDR